MIGTLMQQAADKLADRCPKLPRTRIVFANVPDIAVRNEP